MEIYVPKSEELVEAHKLFEQKESRHRDYWIAVDGVVRGLGSSDLKVVADALAKFLESWNWDFYRYRKDSRATCSDDLQHLLAECLTTILTFRARSLATLNEADRAIVLGLFNSFEQKLGQVGAAKALNPLAPDFFPLWDNAISEEYGVRTSPQGYFLFMVITKYQVRSATFPDGLWPLKTLDEFNYCKYTKGWLA